jgi:ribosomal protein L29
VKGEVSVSDLRNKNNDELKSRVVDLKREMFINRNTGIGNENKGMSRKQALCRKEIARILTILREREFELVFDEVLI